jgi:hypothetical protein
MSDSGILGMLPSPRPLDETARRPLTASGETTKGAPPHVTLGSAAPGTGLARWRRRPRQHCTTRLASHQLTAGLSRPARQPGRPRVLARDKEADTARTKRLTRRGARRALAGFSLPWTAPAAPVAALWTRRWRRAVRAPHSCLASLGAPSLPPGSLAPPGASFGQAVCGRRETSAQDGRLL